MDKMEASDSEEVASMAEEPPPLSELLQRVCAGDERAAADLLVRFGPAVRAVIRTYLTDPKLRRHFDSEDVAQSVFRSFFVRAIAGQYGSKTADELRKLLLAMARNKLLEHVRGESAACRDYRLAGGSPEQHDLVDRAPGPSQQAEESDFLQELQSRLPPKVWRLLDLRLQGHEWAAIAITLGAKPDALRVQLRRALNRIINEREQVLRGEFTND